MGTVHHEVTRDGISAVFTHPDAEADIIFIHGLNGHPQKTWTSEGGVFWPADLLPTTLANSPANIYVYGYNSTVAGNATDNTVLDHAQTLVSKLSLFRQKNDRERKPIIWIVHSLGGIVLKRALTFSKDAADEPSKATRSVYISTYAIIFLGTPHNGSNIASLGRNLQGLTKILFPSKILDTESILLDTLKADSALLEEVSAQFRAIYSRFQIQTAHENLKTDLGLKKEFIVSKESATLPYLGIVSYGIEETHSNMCKFGSTRASGYQPVTDTLPLWIKDGASVIAGRWDVEDDRHAQEVRDKMNEDIQRVVSSRARRPQRFNSHTSQRTALLPERENAPSLSVPGLGLIDSNGQYVGSGSAPSLLLGDGELVHSPSHVSHTSHTSHVSAPEMGSPALSIQPSMQTVGSESSSALETFFVVPEKFRPNSYFVGREQELASLHAMLKDPKRLADGTSAVVIRSLHGAGKTHLAREYFFRHREDYPGGVFWVRAKAVQEIEQYYLDIALRGHLASKFRKEFLEHPGETEKIVRAVQRWFDSREGWLIVFDGIMFTEAFRRFIPDAKNTSIIYTSTHEDGAGDRWFDNPQVLNLEMLPPNDACELLFQELGRANPSKEDRQNALDLVKNLQCLPLVVHISARHLKETKEPLGRFLETHKERSRIKPGDLPAYLTVYEELKKRKATPAMNLMFLLAYFDNRVPVGFLNLGLCASSVPTVLTYDSNTKTTSLTNTLKPLFAFALLERTEADAVSPTSSRSGSSKRGAFKTMMRKSVDVLLVHTVVQLFFVGVLHEEKQSTAWMKRAADVYSSAFKGAQELIQKSSRVGLLDDYRCFKIHGQKLLEHITVRMEKRPSTRADLARPAAMVEERLASCDEVIARLTREAELQLISSSRPGTRTSASSAYVSVFERTNSISDSEDSASQSEPPSVGLEQDDNEVFRFGPRAFSFAPAERFAGSVPDTDAVYFSEHDPRFQNAGPYAKHKGPQVGDIVQLPYAGDEAVAGPSSYGYIGMPSTDGYDTDNATVQATTPRIHDLSPTTTTTQTPSGLLLSTSGPKRPVDDTHHRTVRKQRFRRYHDYIGSMRWTGSSDPRVRTTVAIEQKHAQGTMVSGVSGDGAVAGEATTPNDQAKDKQGPSRFGARNSLRALTNLARFSQGQAADGPPAKDRVKSHTQRNSTGALDVVRPLMTVHDVDQDAQQSEAGTDSVDVRPADERRGSSSFFSSVGKKLKNRLSSPRPASDTNIAEQLSPARATSLRLRPRAHSNASVDSRHNDTSDSLQELLDASTTLRPGASRTAHSSPAQHQGPFQAPYPPENTIPFAIVSRRPLSVAQDMDPRCGYTDLPAGIVQREDQPLHPGRRPDLVADNAFAVTQPSILPLTTTTTERLLRTDGYTSQPMSRNPSSQSQPESGTASRRYPPISSTSWRQHVRNSSSHSSGSRPIPIATQGPPRLRRYSHSSVVETEPSPPTADFFSDVPGHWQRGRPVHDILREEPYLYGRAGASPARSHRASSRSYGHRVAQAQETGSVDMARSHSDTGPTHDDGWGTRSRRGSLSVAASGAWAYRDATPPGSLDVELMAEPMSRGTSGTGSRSGSAPRHVP